tara:strand:- start:1059 stop:1265 length:207 start_codon:yes stop_codon:yes gene_type:complete
MKYKLKDIKSNVNMRNQGLAREQVASLKAGESIEVRNLPPFFNDLVVQEGKATNVVSKAKTKKIDKGE